MLIHYRDARQSGNHCKQPLTAWRKLPRLMAAMCFFAPLTVFAQSTPVETRQGMYAPGFAQQSPLQIPSGQVSIQQVQNTPQSARAIHNLIEDMPQAQDELEIIQRRSQLVVTRANVTRISIADPSVLDIVQYSPREFSMVGLAMGSTTLTLWFENQMDPLIFTVKTIRDPNLDYQRKLDYGKLEKKLALLFPNSKVYLIPMSRKILVRGQARDANDAAHILAIIRGEIINQEGSLFGPQNFGYFGNGVNSGGYVDGAGGGGLGGGYGGGIGGYGGLNAYDLAASFIINELQVPGEFQIAMRIRVAELSRTLADNAGVNINVLFNDARQSISSAVGSATGGTLSGTFENGEIGVFLDWLCSNGTAKILAEPTAVVLSGRFVRFLSGGEFAVPTVVGVGGAQGTTTSFRGFGTSIIATPTIIDRDNIRISVIAEYSNLTANQTVQGIPGLITRRIQTVVEMREGQTMAMAGLLSNRTTVQVQRIPVLGDIPHVGPLLFSSKTMTQEENELLILITPELVRAMDPHEVPPVPGFDMTKPSHTEFWKYNMTEGRPDTGHYQSPPYGSGTLGTNVDYQHFNPGPAGSMYSPIPTNPGPVNMGPSNMGPSNMGPSNMGPIPPSPGPTPIQGQIPYGAPPLMNPTTQYRQGSSMPQASTQRPSSMRGARQPSSSQVIPTGYSDQRQNDAGARGDQRKYRQTNSPSQQ